MDPATVIGLVASVANLAEASSSVLRLVRNFRDGDRDLAALSHDLSIFSEALVGFDRVLRSRHTIHRISGPVLDQVLKHALSLLEDLHGRLKPIASTDISALRRARWLQHKSTITKIHGQLKEQNAILQTFLSITQAQVSHRR